MTGDPVVCLCAGVGEGRLAALIRGGTRTVEALRAACGAGTGCGGCLDDVLELLADHERSR